jgi:hypothetical protein
MHIAAEFYESYSVSHSSLYGEPPPPLPPAWCSLLGWIVWWGSLAGTVADTRRGGGAPPKALAVIFLCPVVTIPPPPPFPPIPTNAIILHWLGRRRRFCKDLLWRTQRCWPYKVPVPVVLSSIQHSYCNRLKAAESMADNSVQKL